MPFRCVLGCVIDEDHSGKLNLQFCHRFATAPHGKCPCFSSLLPDICMHYYTRKTPTNTPMWPWMWSCKHHIPKQSHGPPLMTYMGGMASCCVLQESMNHFGHALFVTTFTFTKICKFWVHISSTPSSILNVVAPSAQGPSTPMCFGALMN